MGHAHCPGCMMLTPAQRDAPDGVARHNIRTGMADVPRIVRLAQKHTDNGEWQASLSYFDEAIREIEDARRLARSMAEGKTDGD